MSNEHKIFLKNLKRRKHLITFTQIIILISFITIWQIASDLGYTNTFITSSPRLVFKTIVNLINEEKLFYHIWITIYETLISFSLGSFIGILIASIMWLSPFTRRVIDPYLTVLNSLPKVALGPIIIVWCGAQIKSIILMALFISVIVMTMTVIESFENVEEDKITLMKVLKANKRQLFFKLILPSSKKTIISALKICVSMSLIGLLPPVGENFIV